MHVFGFDFEILICHVFSNDFEAFFVPYKHEKALFFRRKMSQKPALQTDASRKRFSDPQILQIDIQMVPKWVQRLSWEAWSGLG